MRNRVIIWSYRWYIVLSLGALVIGEVVLIGIGVVLSLLPHMSILIRCVGLRNRGFFAIWDRELQHCIGSHDSQKSDLGLFALYGRVTQNIESSSSPDLSSLSSMRRLRNHLPDNCRSSKVRTHVRLRGCAPPPRSQFFLVGSFLPNVCRRKSGSTYSEHPSWLTMPVT